MSKFAFRNHAELAALRPANAAFNLDNIFGETGNLNSKNADRCAEQHAKNTCLLLQQRLIWTVRAAQRRLRKFVYGKLETRVQPDL